MIYIAHRGFAIENPENTVQAMKSARGRCDYIELDIRQCGSGELVVIHDESVDRVTDGSGLVSEKALIELGALSVLNTGEGIPTLERALQVIPPDTGVVLELKEENIIEAVIPQIAHRDHAFIISSFLPNVLNEVRKSMPGVQFAFIFQSDPMENLRRAIDIQSDYIHPHYELCLESDLISKAHEHDIGVHAWPIQTLHQAEQLVNLNIDGLIADRSGLDPTDNS
ncbi:MAG: glycerophosphodiester phosphodiesterase [Halobacteriaceae archaeon]